MKGSGQATHTYLYKERIKAKIGSERTEVVIVVEVEEVMNVPITRNKEVIDTYRRCRNVGIHSSRFFEKLSVVRSSTNQRVSRKNAFRG